MLPAALAGEDPWIGTWQLNPAKSTRRAEPSPYKRVTFRIEALGDGLKVTYRMVGVRGGVTHHEWTGAFDGRDYPVQGSENVVTNAYRRRDARSYQIVVKVNGSVGAEATVTVSLDGRTLTVATTERAPRGMAINTVAVYDRQ